MGGGELESADGPLFMDFGAKSCASSNLGRGALGSIFGVRLAYDMLLLSKYCLTQPSCDASRCRLGCDTVLKSRNSPTNSVSCEVSGFRLLFPTSGLQKQ